MGGTTDTPSYLITMTQLPSNALKVAIQAADAAREVTLRYFRQPLEINQKSDLSPVTIADQETEKVIQAILQLAFPDYGFYGEETGKTGIDQPWVWVVDPIDGTTSFSTGKPTFGTLIALCYQGQAQLGIIDHPALDDRWIGVKGQSTTHNGKPVKANTAKTSLSEVAACTTTTKMFDEKAMPRYLAVSDQCQYGVFGADCMAYGLLASGFADLVVEASLKPYDYMAVAPVVEGAGGVITDWEGRPITLDTADQILAAANPDLHQAALTAIK